jgi:hypothetical protein
MNSELQKEALAVLAEVWSLAPDVRLGQLWAHIGFLGEAHLGKGLGYLDDGELVALLQRHKSELVSRLSGSAIPPVSTSHEAGTSLSGSSMQPTSSQSERR